MHIQTLSSGTRPWLGQNTLGLINALVAVMLFSLTVPMTQIALGVFPAELTALLRSLVAGLCSLVLVLALRWRLPKGREWLGLIVGGAAVTLVFPYMLSLGLGRWSVSNMGVVLAGVPLVTALLGSLIFKERHPKMFWLSVLMGALILMHFAYQQSTGSSQGLSQGLGQSAVHYSVIIMLLAAGVGYGFGGNVAKTLGGWQTICWMCVLYFPVSALVLGYYSFEGTFDWYAIWEAISGLERGLEMGAQGSLETGKGWNVASVLAMVYLALVSQWLAFHFWYDAMAKVGIGRAGQVQLLQPFFTLLVSLPLLGVALQAQHFVYAALISVAVIVSLRFKKAAV